jgi:glc operon protein GlcG
MKRLAMGIYIFCFVVLHTVTTAQLATKKVLTLEAAKQIVAAGIAEARKDNSAGAIAVVDDGGSLVYLERLDNTFPAASNISIGKARTAAIFKRPTSFFEDVIAKGRTAMTALQDFTPLQGGVPITVAGQIIGAVGVSGANSAIRDNDIALAAVEAGKSLTMGIMADEKHPSVAFFDKDRVMESFSKGAVLFDGSDKYMVHTSRREAAGAAELHEKDADIIYVQEGSATFVTGGTVVDGKMTAQDEIRGKEISGGETRTITKGDVIIVPAGTPHWFKEVPKPITYYVVKAR